jgi:hypothetical protein
MLGPQLKCPREFDAVTACKRSLAQFRCHEAFAGPVVSIAMKSQRMPYRQVRIMRQEVPLDR